MDPLEYLGYFKRNHQEILIEGFSHLSKQIDEITDNYYQGSNKRVTKSRVSQYIIIILFKNVFGLCKGNAHTALSSGTAEIIRQHISDLDLLFPSRSATDKNISLIEKTHISPLNALSIELQDFYYITIGERARSIYRLHFEKSRKSATPMTECFVGIISPSKVFPNQDVIDRGVRYPYFNALIYSYAHRISSIIEFGGIIKTPTWEDNAFIFRLAGELGFITGAPGLKKYYEHFNWIEAHISELTKEMNELLAQHGLHDLTIVSVDSTNIPVDKRDQTGSKGTGSRGTFFGHKASVGAGANCLPISEIMATGRSSDTSLFNDTFTPMDNLAKKAEQDIWVGTADAGYTNISVINRIEQADAIPIVDLNPKNSRLLRKLKNAHDDLKRITKKAIKAGLSPQERKEWIKILQNISKQQGGNIPVKNKIPIIKKVLRKYEERAKRKGLIGADKVKERRLRKNLMNIRREIRQRGSVAEKKIGLPSIAHGTIAWLLIYAIRGQNEGINGILKKRNSMIGDGQHTTWIIHDKPIKGRVEGNLFGIKSVAFIFFQISGRRDHTMRVIHNWRRKQQTFLVVIIVIYCRKAPVRK